MEKSALEVLKKYFGYDSFRYSQDALITDIIAGRDVLGIMPTGAGKSICFQVPALLFSGITLVISPLVSLMKDQVNALNQAGIGAANINSTLSEAQIRKAIKNAEDGAYTLVYVAPERLFNRDFLDFCVGADISMVAVDEAHCVSQWGQDFRPSYTTIPDFLKYLRKKPILAAFTATATPRVKEDIVDKLALNNPSVMISGFDRPNLHFDVLRLTPKYKFMALLDFLRSWGQGRAGIIYCSTRKEVETVCDRLKKEGYAATRYHAGLGDKERHDNQEDFLHDRARVMVATNAFGMGIDKSNVSFVVHYNMPKDIEAYYQEAGRAGRDGADAKCLLFYSKGDYFTHKFLIEKGNSNGSEIDQDVSQALRAANMKRLNEMEMYCETRQCLRAYILRYFGESPDSHCGNCSNCQGDFKDIDITVDIQKILSCIVRMRERFGVNLVVDTLLGKRNIKTETLNLDKLPTFGIVKDKNQAQLMDIMGFAIGQGFL
ncbi:MAG: RecQ family ATP-dependent DNA helicase, partial [Defluviitaleaceae bacterium]|nr:RecQ family ATP-dependent DNA helicase [Defluviitaleaceae bacterium]